MTRTAVRHLLTHPSCLAAIVLAAFSAAVLAVVVLVAWWPALAHEAEVAQALNQHMAHLSALRERAQLAEHYATRQRAVDALEAKLAPKRGTPELVRDIEEIAARSHAELLQFASRTPPKDKSGIDTTIIEFTLKGSYRSFREFLAALGELPELLIVERVVLERVETDVRTRVVLLKRAREGA